MTEPRIKVRVRITSTMIKNYYYLTLFILEFAGAAAEEQKIIFYTDKDCSGLSETFYSSKNINNSWIHGAKSVKISGLWQMYWNEYGKGITSAIFSNQLRHYPLCKDKPSFMPHHTGEFLRFTRYGSTHVNFPEVIFFTERNLQGASYSFTSDNDTFSMCNVSVKSMAQFSNGTWLAYSEKFYRGKELCICSVFDWWRWKTCDKQDIPKNGFQHWNFQTERKLGSIKLVDRQDCSCRGYKVGIQLLSFIFLMSPTLLLKLQKQFCPL